MDRRRTHGMTNTRLYTIWNSMHCRCRYPGTNGYKRYGGRGIKVCEEWQKFEPFYEWAIGAGYSDKLTLDRIDNNKDYSPNNCRWATKEQQSNNQRTNNFITLNDEKMTITNWSRKTGLSSSTIRNRLRSGMTVEEALLTPNKVKERPLIAVNMKTDEILFFKSSKDAERQGFSRPSIWRALTGEYKHHKGMKWKYADDSEVLLFD